MTTIQGSHALVTGGSSGIGLCVARELGRRGARISLVARRPAELASAASALAAAGTRVQTRSADVAEREDLHGAIEALSAEQGPVDILVTSAGITYPGHFADLQPEQFRRLMDVNYFGTLHAIEAVVPAMVKAQRGSIVGVSSTAGLIGVFGYSAYCPTKFAVRGLLETLRCELAPHGVHVGCVFPPDTETPQLSFEEPLKPAETKAISGGIKPISADRVAASIVKGIERDRFWIMADLQTRLLSRFGGLGRGLIERDFDRKVRGAAASSAP